MVSFHEVGYFFSTLLSDKERVPKVLFAVIRLTYNILCLGIQEERDLRFVIYK
jgi:hypothetical protein